MSVTCGSFSLNRISRITDNQAVFFEAVSDKIYSIAKKYNLYVDINSANEGEYLYLSIHNSKPILIKFYSEEILDLPNIENDESFYDRSENFIVESESVFLGIKKMSFSSPGNRIFISAS